MSTSLKIGFKWIPVISQHWFRYWIGAVIHEAITRANVHIWLPYGINRTHWIQLKLILEFELKTRPRRRAKEGLLQVIWRISTLFPWNVQQPKEISYIIAQLTAFCSIISYCNLQQKHWKNRRVQSLKLKLYEIGWGWKYQKKEIHGSYVHYSEKSCEDTDIAWDDYLQGTHKHCKYRMHTYHYYHISAAPYWHM